MRENEICPSIWNGFIATKDRLLTRIVRPLHLHGPERIVGLGLIMRYMDQTKRRLSCF